MKLSGGIGIAGGALLLLVSASVPASADCGAEIQKLRAVLQESPEGDSHRLEMVKLVEKAEKDSKNGRERLCIDAANRARHLAATPAAPASATP